MSKGGAALGVLGLVLLAVGLAGARQDRPADPAPRPDGLPRAPDNPGGPAAFGRILPGPLQEQLHLTVEQKQQVEQLQREVDDRLAKILTAEQRRELRGMRDVFGRLGDPPLVHDVALAREGGVFYLSSTGSGVILHTSTDLVKWRRRGPMLEQRPGWAEEVVPGWRGSCWAPDISFFHGKWHLYYSVSTFGRNRSAIGLATNVTLHPGRPDYRWEDQGPVIESTWDDDWNTIDPNLVLDEAGRPWLAFGSFWGGLQLMEIDPATGKPPGGQPRLRLVASRRSDRGTRRHRGPVPHPSGRVLYWF